MDDPFDNLPDLEPEESEMYGFLFLWMKFYHQSYDSFVNPSYEELCQLARLAKEYNDRQNPEQAKLNKNLNKLDLTPPQKKWLNARKKT